MSIFCPNCGRELPDNASFCDGCGTRIPKIKKPANSPEPAEDRTDGTERFLVFETMQEAAEAAIELNSDGEWSYWDEPESFNYNAKKLIKFSVKEDKYADEINEDPVFIVSSEGAVGHMYIDSEDQDDFFEWVFYTHADQPEDLPSQDEMLEIGRSLL